MEIYYEKVLDNPVSEFARLFRFLHLKCRLNMPALEERVALHDSNRNIRAKAKAGFCKVEKYSNLPEIVNSELAEEIKILGYSSDD